MSAAPDRTGPSGRRGGSLLLGGLAMIGLSIVLGWLPILGTAIAGFVGGRLIRTPGTAVAVALVPAILLAGVFLLIFAAFDLGWLGVLAGAGGFVFVAVQDIPLLIGAYLGASSSR